MVCLVRPAYVRERWLSQRGRPEPLPAPRAGRSQTSTRRRSRSRARSAPRRAHSRRAADLVGRRSSNRLPRPSRTGTSQPSGRPPIACAPPSEWASLWRRTSLRSKDADCATPRTRPCAPSTATRPSTGTRPERRPHVFQNAAEALGVGRVPQRVATRIRVHAQIHPEHARDARRLHDRQGAELAALDATDRRCRHADRLAKLGLAQPGTDPRLPDQVPELDQCPLAAQCASR